MKLRIPFFTSLHMKPLFIFLFSLLFTAAQAQNPKQKIPTEDDYYRILPIATPEGVLLEVGGVAMLPDGRLAVCTRRGDVWLIENPAMADDRIPAFTHFASGLHEALGLVYHDQALFVAQRGELTKLKDTNGDDRADVYETVYAWPVSGHYHEYSFGPKMAPDGDFFVTGNVAFGDEEWWRGESRVPWRGWTMKISPDGRMQPWATGMRSPCGLGIIDGEFFYADNQGDWIGSGGLVHIPKGSFAGHPAGLRWSQQPNSPVTLTQEKLYARVDPRQTKVDGQFIKPENRTDEQPHFLFELKKDFPEVRLPAVWLPHGVLGISNSEIITDDTGGKFGPFAGQVLVGDQGQSKIMRVVLEKVNGEYQGVAFDFKSGFQSGVLRMCWGHDGSLYAGLTNRGWGSAGTANEGLQRLVWTGKMPMEMKTVHAQPDGFEIVFTQPVDKTLAGNVEAYSGRRFIYKYHPVYGSPTVNEEKLNIDGLKISEDGYRVRLRVANLRPFYVHELHVFGVRAASGVPVLHPSAYYTLNAIPVGQPLPAAEWSTTRTPAKAVATPKVKVTPAAGKTIAYADIEPLLVKNTCTACHQTNKRQVGPSFADIAKRRYSDERIVQLIYMPEPKNWPEHETPMAAMPQVPRAEALRIARWINSLLTTAP